MRMQADHFRASCFKESFELIELEQGDAELRVKARGAHLRVMSAPIAGVDAQDDLAALEQLRPRLDGMQVVERDVDALFERPGVFSARREVRCEENPASIKVG